MKFKNKTSLLFLLALILTTAVSSKAQSQVASVVITRINGDAANFPEIFVNFRAVDSRGDHVLGLTESDISLAESNQEVSLTSGPTPKNDAGIWIHFVINGGVRMRDVVLENVLNSMQTFVNNPGFFRENDRIAVSVLEGAGVSTRLTYSSDANRLREAVSSANPCNQLQCTRPFASVDSLLADSFWTDAGANPKIIIFLTPLIDDQRDRNGVVAGAGRIEALGGQAASKGITIYTIVFDDPLESNKLANLAKASNGAAFTFDDLNLLNEQIGERHRAYYTASYRTTSNTSGNRKVVVTYTGGADRVSDDADFEVLDLQPPSIVIENPDPDITLSRESAETIQKISGRIVFTNYEQRALSKIQLIVNDALVDENIDPQGLEFEFPFPWEMIRENGQVKLTIKAFDELGLHGEKSITTTVVVLEPEVTPNAELTSVPDPSLPPSPPESGTLSTLILVIAIVGLGGAMTAFVITNRQKAPVQNVRNTIMRGIDRITKIYQRHTEVKGYLIVLQGDASIGKSLEIYGSTRVGRSKEDADLLFQQHDEHSPISRLHCTILDEEDHFKLRDEDSANGTYLNGVRLLPMEPRELFDGDEIELARVERGGVKLRFQSVHPQQNELTVQDKSTTRAVPKPNRQPNFGQQSGDRF
jgi:hypothetical protein